MTEKIFFISDIHSNLPALEKVIIDIHKRDSSPIIYDLGDIVGYGGFPVECIRTVIDNNILSILGNHDLPVARGEDVYAPNLIANAFGHWNSRQLILSSDSEIEFLESNDYERSIEFAGISIKLTHGDPRTPKRFDYIMHDNDAIDFMRWAALSNDVDMFVFGHSHLQMLIEEAVNPVNTKTVYTSKINWFKDEPGMDKTSTQDSTEWRYLLDKDKSYGLCPGSVGKSRDRIKKACYSYLEKDNSGIMSANFVQLDYDIESLFRKFIDIMKEVGLSREEFLHHIDNYQKGR